MDLGEKIKSFAGSLGFHLVRVIPAEPLKAEKGNLNKWLKKGYAGDMGYMEKEPSKRTNPAEILSKARSIICLGMNYFQDAKESAPKNSGKISRYAWGKDYHLVIGKKLKKLRNYIINQAGTPLDKSDFKLYVDAGPFLEKGYAAKAGLGFIGKNTTLITKEYGSWVFLAEIITKAVLPYDKAKNDFFGSCGTCARCIDACPTNALKKPYELDARRCISYLTIENKKNIPSEFKRKTNSWVFGCDICQQVCPYNSRAKKTDVKEFLEHIAGPNINLKDIKNLDEAGFSRKFEGSPLKRAGLKGITRNIQNML